MAKTQTQPKTPQPRFSRVQQRRDNNPKPTAYTSWNGQWLPYDSNNDYPDEIAKIAQNSPTHGAILRTKAAMAYGEGPDYGDNPPEAIAELRSVIHGCAGYADGDEEGLFKRILADIVMYGGFALKIARGAETGEVVGVWHIDFRQARLGAVGLDGSEPNTVWLCADWLRRGTTLTMEEQFPRFSPGRKKEGESQVMYATTYTPGMEIYPIPDYLGAITWAQVEIEIGNYHLNNARYGFTPTLTLAMPDTMEEEQRLMFEKSLNDSYVGTDTAGGVLIVYGVIDRQSGTATLPKFEAIPRTSSADEYLVTLDQARQSIITAHRLNSPTLAGLAGAGGLGGNASEIKEAHLFFYHTVVRDYINQFNDLMWPLLKGFGFTQPIDFVYSSPYPEPKQPSTQPEQGLPFQTPTIDEPANQPG
jgi:hypothetical protein